ncbi:hypothetical protein L4X63_04465 [Geomonas sp. Red32]|uniref:hypothetical protein n=1 Tax=Geomonas sp. Red32 TaxID=2912856 RepID=UPI00202CD1BC|nr:hypothetical protein [Geomonas sp. Red32]MCM0080839.1 hypothetical protein [Geomonas sp. Red32]
MKLGITGKLVLKAALLAMLLALASSCGGEGGSNQKTVLKLSTTGLPSEPISSISISIAMPQGVQPRLNPDLSVPDSVVQVSGVAMPGSTSNVWFGLPRNGSNFGGGLNFTITTSNPAGFGVGEFATVSLDAGSHTSSDFTISPLFSAAGIDHAPVSGISPTLAVVYE